MGWVSSRLVHASMATQLIRRHLGRAEGLGLRHRPGPAAQPRLVGSDGSGGGGSSGGGVEGAGAVRYQEHLTGSGAAAARDAQVRWASSVSDLGGERGCWVASAGRAATVIVWSLSAIMHAWMSPSWIALRNRHLRRSSPA